MKHKLFRRGAAGIMTGLMCMMSVPALPTAVLNTAYAASSGQTLSVGNGQNQHKEDNVDGYSYEIWLDQTGGSGSMTLGSGGSFNTEWSAQVSAGNFLARRGRNYDASKKATQYGTIVMDYAADYSASSQGNSRLCVYGWMKDPLVEYYIIEDWVNWCPSAQGGAQTVTIDGAEYEIFQLDHTGPTILGDTRTFKQYFSVRKQKRTSGTITVSDHFAAWEKAGWNIGNLTEVALNVEGWESSGKANVSKLTISAGEGGSSNAQPAQQNNDWNNQQQNQDWNQWNQQPQQQDWNQQWNQPQQNDWNNQQNQDWNQWQQPQQQNQDWNQQWNQPQQNNNQQASSGSGLNTSATMVDDFRNGSSKYFIASDGWTNGDPFDCGWYASQTNFSGGSLNLTLDKDNTGKYNYAGAEYRTTDFYHYGYYETSMQPIKNVGVNSSFFTYTGESDGNPWDEIDIEFLCKDTTKVQFNYYTNGQGNHEKIYDLGFDASQGFHTYGFDWQPDHITWYVDGKPVYTATENLPKTAGKIMMNVWPGKGVDEWLGHYDGKTPLTAHYQWVTYDKNGKSGGQQQNNQPQQTTQYQQPATTVATTVVTTQQQWNQWEGQNWDNQGQQQNHDWSQQNQDWNNQNQQNNDWNNQNQNQNQNQDWNQQWTQPQVNDWNQQNNDWNNQNQNQNQDWNQQWTQPQVNDWNQQNNDWNNQNQWNNQQQNQDWNNQNQWNNQQQNNDWGNWNQWSDQQWNQWNEWNPWTQQVSMWGDANVNGSVDIGDAVAIMQGIANPDQYGFNDQNRWNADVYQAGTGVTAQDATAIQRYLLQSTPQLPESYWVGNNGGWYN